MSLNTSLKGRLRNTNLPKTHTLFPLYEAVVNPIHSIDKRIKNDQEFEIIDNEIEFNKNNYESFQTLDTAYKIKQGCRSAGGLLWLKAFKKVSIHSSFAENSALL